MKPKTTYEEQYDKKETFVVDGVTYKKKRVTKALLDLAKYGIGGF